MRMLFVLKRVCWGCVALRLRCLKFVLHVGGREAFYSLNIVSNAQSFKGRLRVLRRVDVAKARFLRLVRV